MFLFGENIDLIWLILIFIIVLICVNVNVWLILMLMFGEKVNVVQYIYICIICEHNVDVD